MRGRGLMLALETVQAGTLQPDAAVASELLQSTRDAGLLIGKGGLYGNVLRIAPALTVTAEEIDEAASILAKAIDSIVP